MFDVILKKLNINISPCNDTKLRGKLINKSAIVGIVVNTMLFVLKLIMGIISASLAVTADAFNNLFDAGSSIISLVGMKLSMKPPDREHPFGHGRVEYVAALVVSLTVIEVGINFFKEAIDKLIHPSDVNSNTMVLVFLILSIIVKLFLSLYNTVIAKRTDSDIPRAVAADCISDCFVTATSMIPLITIYFTNIKIDGFVGLIVSLIIIKTGFEISKNTLDSILGKPISKEEYDKINEMVRSYEGIIGTHDLIVHSYGSNNKMASIHAEVSRYVDVSKSHALIDKIEHEITKKLNIFLVIHMDPVETNNPALEQLKNEVLTKVKELDDKLSIHDFRYVGTGDSKNLIFDMVIPYSYNEDDESKLLDDVINNIKTLNPNYDCVITIDRSYVN